MQTRTEHYILKIKNMRKIHIIFFILLTTLMYSQSRYSNGDYGFIDRLLDSKDLENFYYIDWELNPADFQNKLSDVENLKKMNQQSNIIFKITKNKDITDVEVIINTVRFSESSYKNGVLHGKKIIYHDNGSVFQEIEFKNGKANGIAKVYDSKYNLVLETTYKDNIKNGSRKYINYRRDQTTVEWNYENGKIVGNLKIYNENKVYFFPNDLKKGKVKQFVNDKLISEYTIINEKTINGDLLYYNQDTGKIIEKIPYYFGKINGFIEYFDFNGELQYKNEYKQGKKIGKHNFYTVNKQLVSEEFYNQDGLKTGTWKTFEREGIVTLEKTYINDKLEGITIEYKNGIITQSTEYKNDEKNGIAKYYDTKTNILKSEIVYKNGIEVLEKQFFPNGLVFTEITNTNQGQRISIKHYDLQGKLFYENKWNENNKPIGIHKYITLNQTNNLIVRSDTEYNANGDQIFSTYYSEGTSDYTKTQWKNGKWHGLKVNYNSVKNTTTEEYYFQSKKVTKDEFEKLNK